MKMIRTWGFSKKKLGKHQKEKEIKKIVEYVEKKYNQGIRSINMPRNNVKRNTKNREEWKKLVRNIGKHGKLTHLNPLQETNSLNKRREE